MKNKLVIRRELKQHDEKYQKAREEALLSNLMQTCQCCFDDELIPEECYFCKNGCIFCKDCVKGGAEAAIGDGKLYFACLVNCGYDFGISTLQVGTITKLTKSIGAVKVTLEVLVGIYCISL